jgi:hypothetical protein
MAYCTFPRWLRAGLAIRDGCISTRLGKFCLPNPRLKRRATSDDHPGFERAKLPESRDFGNHDPIAGPGRSNLSKSSFPENHAETLLFITSEKPT